MACRIAEVAAQTAFHARMFLKQADMMDSAVRAPFRTEAYERPVDGDRRSRVRFPVNMPLRFCTLGKGRDSGVGRVLNMSSAEALVSCTHELQLGRKVQLTIQWPAPQGGRIPVRLIVIGKVVRLEVSAFAVAFSRHRFVALHPVEEGILPETADAVN